jgi:hypothetical protein
VRGIAVPRFRGREGHRLAAQAFPQGIPLLPGSRRCLVLALALILFGTFVSRMPRFKVRRVAGPAGGRGCSATAPDPPLEVTPIDLGNICAAASAARRSRRDGCCAWVAVVAPGVICLFASATTAWPN